MCILNFLNQNSGAISVLVTIVLVVITWWYTQLTKRILQKNEEIHNEEMRPYIVAMIENVDHFLELSIKNIGKRPAKNLKVTFTPSLDKIDKLQEKDGIIAPHKNLLKQEFMPPDFNITTNIDYAPFFHQRKLDSVEFSVNLEYLDMNNKKYNENYKINLSNYIYARKVASFTLNYHIEKIEKNTLEISKALNILNQKIKKQKAKYNLRVTPAIERLDG